MRTDTWLLMHPAGGAAMSTTADLAEDVMELEIMVQGITCSGCTSRVQDTPPGELAHMSSARRPPRRAPGQASRQSLH